MEFSIDKKPLTEDIINSEKEKIKIYEALLNFLFIGLCLFFYFVFYYCIQKLQMELANIGLMPESVIYDFIAFLTIVIAGCFFTAFVLFFFSIKTEFNSKMDSINIIDDEKCEELLIIYKNYPELSNYQREIIKTGRIRPLNCEYKLIKKIIDDNGFQGTIFSASQRSLKLDKQLSEI